MDYLRRAQAGKRAPLPKQEGRAEGRRPLRQREDADAVPGGQQRQLGGFLITSQSSDSESLGSLTVFCWC